MRISKKLAVGAATLALVAAAIAPAAHATDVSVPGSEFSLGLAPEVTGSPGVPAAYIRLWDMQTAWRDINPAPGVFDFSIMDQRVAQAEAAGAKPLVVLGLTPQWAAKDPSAGDPRWGAGTASPPANADTYTAYITAIMQRYGARIGAVEVWNEANLQTFWRGTPAEMADLTARAYKAIKAISLNTQVIAASTTTRLASSVAEFLGPYATALQSMGYPIDAWTIHSYPAGNQGPSDRYQDVLEWRGVLIDATENDAAALNKQVWDTEINYGLAGPGDSIPHSDFDANTSGQFVARTFVDSVRLGVDATFWYMWTASSFSLLGVQMFNGTDTTIGAYNTTRAWLSGSTLKGCDQLNGVIRCYFTGGAGAFYLAMSANDSGVSFAKQPTATAENWLGQPVNASGPVTLASGPVKFTCLPSGTDQCTLGATPSAAVPLPGSGPAITKTISITVAKGRVYGRKGLVITGTSTGMTGEIVTSHWKQIKPKGSASRKPKYAVGNKATVQADGTFTVGKVTKFSAKAYVKGFDVKSNTASG
ncbi:MAG: hypothetical protein Q7L55_10430 [Actinomycetota bacterium]|nr:hypothetical protein [Actinomycetota bacterium]